MKKNKLLFLVCFLGTQIIAQDSIPMSNNQSAEPAYQESWYQRGSRYAKRAAQWAKKHKKPLIAAGVAAAGIGGLVLAGRFGRQQYNRAAQALADMGLKNYNPSDPDRLDSLKEPYYTQAIKTIFSLMDIDPDDMDKKFDEINADLNFDLFAANFWNSKDKIISAAKLLQKQSK